MKKPEMTKEEIMEIGNELLSKLYQTDYIERATLGRLALDLFTMSIDVISEDILEYLYTNKISNTTYAKIINSRDNGYTPIIKVFYIEENTDNEVVGNYSCIIHQIGNEEDSLINEISIEGGKYEEENIYHTLFNFGLLCCAALEKEDVPEFCIDSDGFSMEIGNGMWLAIAFGEENEVSILPNEIIKQAVKNDASLEK